MLTLDDDAIQTALAELEAWDLDAGKLHRVFTFRDFRDAFGFMTTCALVAEAMDHHPEWLNVWRTVEVWLSTHSAGGITAKDLELARAMDARVRR